MRWVVVLAALVTACSAPQRGTPDVGTLVEATRNIDVQKDESITSLVFTVESPSIGWTMDLRWRAPDRIELLIRDRNDDMPMAFLSDRTLLLYGPAEGKLYRCDDAMAFVSHHLDKEGLKVGFGIHHPEDSRDKEGRPYTIRLQLRDILDRTDREGEITRRPDGSIEFRISGEDGALFASEYDLGREYPFVGYRLRGEDKHEDLFVVTALVNEPLEDSDFRNLDFDRLEQEFVVETFDVPPESEWDSDVLQITKHLVLRILTRAALTRESMRPELESHLQTEIPWDEIEKNDREMAPRLRVLFAEKEE